MELTDAQVIYVRIFSSGLEGETLFVYNNFECRFGGIFVFVRWCMVKKLSRGFAGFGLNGLRSSNVAE